MGACALNIAKCVPCKTRSLKFFTNLARPYHAYNMASKFLRRKKWWVKFRHPATGIKMRESLETDDEVYAELLKQRLDLEVALLDPRFQLARIPAALLSKLGRPNENVGEFLTEAKPVKASDASPITPSAPAALVTAQRAKLDDVIPTYLNFIRSENVKAHAANKTSILRRFIGSKRLERIGGPTLKFAQKDSPDAPFFTGVYLDEITPAVMQEFVEGLGVTKSTMRHYRQFFHHFFEVCVKYGFYHPTNWHCPNPAAALPSYHTKNRHIIFLREVQMEEQFRALVSAPAVKMAVEIMIYAGLRRDEMLWLTKESIADDLSYLSVINRNDEDANELSSLKTGERTVTILPPLKKLLEAYLPTLKNQWLIPSPRGVRWDKDNFSERLRLLNKAAGLTWNCNQYRHTYATQRAKEGWSLFRISKEMGNSVVIVERHYAGFIRPEGA